MSSALVKISRTHKSSELTDDDMFKLADLYFNKQFKMYEYIYNSFNYFVDVTLHQILVESDNVFYEHIDEEKNKMYRYRFKFSNILIRPPTLESENRLMFPNDARDLNLTYSAKITGTVTQIQETINMMTDEVETKIIGTEEHNVPITNLPILVRSKYCSLTLRPDLDNKECIYDPGCHFIIKGSEKVVISLEKLCENRPIVTVKKDVSGKLFAVQITSKSENNYSQIMQIKMKKDGTLVTKIPVFGEIPAFVLFKVLGIVSDRDIMQIIVQDDNDMQMANFVDKSLDDLKSDKKHIVSYDDALDYLLSKSKLSVKIKYAEKKHIKQKQKELQMKKLIESHFLPHIENSFVNKAHFYAYMINKLYQTVLKRRQPDDRDSFVNKRVELVGNLFEELYRIYHKKTIYECSKFFKKRNDNNHENPINVVNKIKPNIIEQGLSAALLTGLWGRKKGVAQMLQRLTYLLSLSFYRRLDAPNVDASTNKLTGPRHYHTSSVGFLCCVESPEHAKIGLTKHLTLIASVTMPMPEQKQIVREILEPYIRSMSSVSFIELANYTKVFINGDWIGITDNAIELEKIFRSKKRKGEIDVNIGIVNNITQQELRINIDGGRLFRPVLCVTDNQLNITKTDIDSITLDVSKIGMISDWDKFMMQNPNLIEYIDVEEAEMAMIAHRHTKVTKMRSRMLLEPPKLDSNTDVTNRYDKYTFVKYNYCEIHPSLLMSTIATNIPFANHNQGPRNMFQYAQGKQAMGCSCTNMRYRLDKTFLLYHPMKPLITTKTNGYTNIGNMPCGENCVVSIASYSGYNIEDAIVFNQSAIDRGIFGSSSYKKFQDQIQKNQITSQDDVFMKPNSEEVSGMKHGLYSKLDDSGSLPEECIVEYGDILIGKVTPIQQIGMSNKKYKDNSTIYKDMDSGRIDKIWKDIYNIEGYEMRKVRIRSERIPNIGDKFCCYTSDHEILTDMGWIPISHVALNTYVACIVNDQIEYHRPHHVVHEQYEGIVYQLESNDTSLCVTPNHRMYVKFDYEQQTDSKLMEYKFVYAESLVNKTATYMLGVQNGIKCQFSHNHQSFVLKNVDCDDRTIEMNLWLKIYGYMQYADDDGITFDTSQVGIVIKSYLNSLRYDQQLIMYFKQLNKCCARMPYWVWQLTACQSKNLLMYLTLNNTTYVKTYNQEFVDDFQRLCLHAGLSYRCEKVSKMTCDLCCKSFKSHLHADTNFKEYRLFVQTVIETCVNKDNEIQDKLVMYKGTVHCCSVPGIGVVCVRRTSQKNTKQAVWCGNSLYGQKATMGLKLRQADMPFTKHGIAPDLIISPNAFPKRMTMAQFIECTFGKVCALKGVEGDGTPFNKLDLASIRQELTKLGFKHDGTEELYNGMTGEKIQSSIFIGPTYYQRLKHLVSDKIHCLTADHDVLTSTGWKPIATVTLEDKVACLINNELKYEHPTALHHYPNYKGKMYKIWNQQIDLDVTANHRMYVAKSDFDEYKLEKIEDIIGQFRKYKHDAQWNVEDYQHVLIDSEFKVDMKSWLFMFGIWITDGSLFNGGVKWQSLAGLRHEHIEKYINKLGFDYEYFATETLIENDLLYDDLKYHGGITKDLKDRHMPEWVWKLSSDQCKTLIDGMTYACDQKQWTRYDEHYFTESKILADDLQRLCLHAGWTCEINIADCWPKEKGTMFNRYYCKIKKDDTAFTNTPINNLFTQHEKMYEGDAPVYCLSVPNEVFYVRRNGKGVWTGNSRARGPRTKLTRQPLEGRTRGGGLRTGEMERDAIIAHGLAFFLKERLMDASDIYWVYICGECGLFAQRLTRKNSRNKVSSNDIYYCQGCDNKSNIAKVRMPYAFKLMLQELMAMNIAPRIRVHDVV
jgi:DNA-directed RNA polymerase II subunit RPB2